EGGDQFVQAVGRLQLWRRRGCCRTCARTRCSRCRSGSRAHEVLQRWNFDLLSNEDAIRILDTIESRQRLCQSGVTVCILSDSGQGISGLHNNFSHCCPSFCRSRPMGMRSISIVQNLYQAFQSQCCCDGIQHVDEQNGTTGILGESRKCKCLILNWLPPRDSNADMQKAKDLRQPYLLTCRQPRCLLISLSRSRLPPGLQPTSRWT